MIPIYDKNVVQVAWLCDDGHLFDLDLRWIGYVVNDNLWSARTGSWLGPILGSSLLDRAGNVVAWGSDRNVEGTTTPLRPLTPLKPLRPLTPLKPLTPLRPLKPLDPIGGWSALPWARWLSQ